MSVVAVLGWGSLIWEPKVLRTKTDWFKDGPTIRVEFLRRSDRGRITLVLDESAAPVPSLWAIVESSDIEAAAENLREREGVRPKNFALHIGRWATGQDTPSCISALPEWAKSRGVDAVIWTALPHKFHDDGRRPSAEDIVAYLEGTKDVVKEDAERYVRCAPRQIDTAYRRIIAERLGWIPTTSDS
jgi:hypothetical protein